MARLSGIRSLIGLLILDAAVLRAGVNVKDDWKNLLTVTRDRSYVIVLRDCTAVNGHLMAVDEKGLVLEEESRVGGRTISRSITVQRSEVLRVGETANVSDTVFSGRSSWVDVKAAVPRRTEYLIVATKKGKTWRLNGPTVSDDAITDRGKTIAKAEVRSVSYVRYKPFSAREENSWFDGGLMNWPFLRFREMLQPKISVTLYDSDSNEDTLPVICSSR